MNTCHVRRATCDVPRATCHVRSGRQGIRTQKKGGIEMPPLMKRGDDPYQRGSERLRPLPPPNPPPPWGFGRASLTVNARPPS